MRLLWLPKVIRDAGLTCHEYSGWQSRGSSTYGPVSGIVCHGTGGSSTSRDEAELRVLAVTGSSSATTVPISQLYLSRSGAVWVVASGTATGVKTGTSGPLKGLSDDAVLQIEAQHATTEPWTDIQYWVYVRLVAALVAYRESGYAVPVDRVVGHGEHQPRDKTDPWFDMAKFRTDVRAVLNGDDMTPQERAMLFNANANAFAARTGVPAPVYYGDDPSGKPTEFGVPLFDTLARIEAAVGAVAARVDIDPDELAALKLSAEEGARAGVLAAAHDLAQAIAVELAGEFGLTEVEAEAAAERAVRKVLGAVDNAAPQG